MTSSSKIKEKQLHQIWFNQDFISELKAVTGEPITVLNPGDYNNDTGGPDFKHARVKIGNLTFVGDVEIDSDYSDWKNHGHNINNHYNKVILHISYSNKQKQNYVYTSNGRKVISVPIKDFTSADNLKFEEKIAGRKKNASKDYILKCDGEIDVVNINDRQKFILQLGLYRFQQKCQRIYQRLKELKFISDLHLKEPVIRYELTKEFNQKEFTHEDFREKYIWKQLLYELIFEALGYVKNKNIMRKLAQNVTLDFLDKLGSGNDLNIKIESAFFHISGLMPDLQIINKSDSEYLLKLVEHWNRISTMYDGKKFDETQWQFLGQRPQNFPTVRISGGAKLAEDILSNNLAGNIINKFSEIKTIKVLINSIRSLLIVKAVGYWQNHFVFNTTSKIKLNYIIGLNRGDEIFINVILPYLSIYFDMFGNESLSKKVLLVYNEYEQKLENKIVRDVSNGLQLDGLNKKTIYSQGMIEIYRNYCTKNKCLDCDIGKKIFN